uniref:LysR substrate-binding domain-containing protein n=2 Tax=Pseudomonas TaxID=286 RepID=UPI003F96772F
RDIPCKVLRGDNRPGQLTLDEYCQRPHAMVSFSGDLSGNIDLDLAKVGRTRRVVLGVPQFSGLRAMLAGTEMIATVPDYAACALVEGGALRAEEPPFPIEAAQLSMAWSGVHDNDPAERWLRSRISQYMSEPLNIPDPFAGASYHG